MQPPTRTARRNGSGIASGRRRGGTDGASARKADGGGRKGARPNKNPARRTRTGLLGTGRQRCHLGFGCHRRRECGQHFCRGSESCVHRFDCPGGGPFCAACCRAGFSHSRLQETSAGRNLITLFHTVNNRAYFFSGPPARTAAASAAHAFVECARAHPTDSRCVSFDIAETQAWRGFRRCDVFSRGVFSITRIAARGYRRRSAKANPEEKIPVRDGRGFRVAQAELRETARTVFGLRRRSTTASSERRACRRDDSLARTTATNDVAEHVCLHLGGTDERQRRHARRRPFVCRGRRAHASTRCERGEVESVFRQPRRPTRRPHPAFADGIAGPPRRFAGSQKTLVFSTSALHASIARDSVQCLDEHGKGRIAPVSTALLRVGASGSEGRRREVRGERAAGSSHRVHASRSDVASGRGTVVGRVRDGATGFRQTDDARDGIDGVATSTATGTHRPISGSPSAQRRLVAPHRPLVGRVPGAAAKPESNARAATAPPKTKTGSGEPAAAIAVRFCAPRCRRPQGDGAGSAGISGRLLRAARRSRPERAVR